MLNPTNRMTRSHVLCVKCNNNKVNVDKVLNKITNRKFEKMNDILSFVKSESEKDIKYFDTFEKQRLDRVGDIIQEIQAQSEKDLKFLQELMQDFELSNTDMTDNIEENVSIVKKENDEFFEQ